MNWKGRKDPSLEGPPREPFRMPAQNERPPADMEEEILRGTKLESTPRLSEFAPAAKQADPRDALEQGRRIGVATAKSFAALPIGQLDDLAKKHADAKARFDAAKAELLAHFEHVAEDLVSAYEREIESLEVDSNELEQLLVTIAQRRKPPEPEPLVNPIQPRSKKPQPAPEPPPEDAA